MRGQRSDLFGRATQKSMLARQRRQRFALLARLETAKTLRQPGQHGRTRARPIERLAQNARRDCWRLSAPSCFEPARIERLTQRDSQPIGGAAERYLARQPLGREAARETRVVPARQPQRKLGYRTAAEQLARGAG
jgi:hypothetical protein